MRYSSLEAEEEEDLREAEKSSEEPTCSIWYFQLA